MDKPIKQELEELTKELIDSLGDIMKCTNNEVKKATGYSKFELINDTVKSFAPLFEHLSIQYDRNLYAEQCFKNKQPTS